MAAIPRPEYPRPEFVRGAEWINLNGEWNFAFDDRNLGLTEEWFAKSDLAVNFNKKICVPFSFQTESSGINDKSIHEVVWYARAFTIPDNENWLKKDILLNFGAVDYKSTVWINGKEVGHNQGGHVPFSFNIYPYLHELGRENTLIIRVEDFQDPRQPRGKQAESGISKGIDYYCTTGIWQTVWLEPAAKMRIDYVKITPLLEVGGFETMVYLHAPSIGWKIEACVYNHGSKDALVSSAEISTSNAAARMLITIPNPNFWHPNSPHLYDISIRLYGNNPHNDKNEELCDEVTVYGGLRSISLKDGKVVLNDKPCFLKMILDQGYWPKSGMTAETDEELRKDVEITKAFGYNGVRKHQKIEDPRWLYWCDRLGLMVWSEMPNAREWSTRAEELFIMEWERSIKRDYNHPSIITWVPNNESWGYPGIRDWHFGQYAFVERVVSETRKLDSTRPVVDNDGWEHTDIGDICAIHDYSKTGEEIKKNYQTMIERNELPDMVGVMDKPLYIRGSRYRGQPIILTECGGFLSKRNDIPAEEQDELYNAYGSVDSNEKLLKNYEDLMRGISELPFLAGFCYTQLIDVEQEMNGLLAYDRSKKVEPDGIKEIHERFFGDK